MSGASSNGRKAAAGRTNGWPSSWLALAAQEFSGKPVLIGRPKGAATRSKATPSSHSGEHLPRQQRQPLLKHMNLLTVRFFRRLVTSLPTHAARPIRRARNQGAAGLVLFCSNANDSSDNGASPATTSSPFLSPSPSGPIQIQSSLDPSTLNGAEQVVRVPQVHRCHLWCPSCVLLCFVFTILRSLTNITSSCRLN